MDDNTHEQMKRRAERLKSQYIQAMWGLAAYEGELIARVLRRKFGEWGPGHRAIFPFSDGPGEVAMLRIDPPVHQHWSTHVIFSRLRCRYVLKTGRLGKTEHALGLEDVRLLIPVPGSGDI